MFSGHTGRAGVCNMVGSRLKAAIPATDLDGDQTMNVGVTGKCH